MLIDRHVIQSHFSALPAFRRGTCERRPGGNMVPLFAADTWPVALVLAAPTILVLFGCSRYLARSPRERLFYLSMSGVGAMVAILAVVFLCRPRPTTWLDLHKNAITVGVAPLGAIAGVGLAAILLRMAQGVSPDVASTGSPEPSDGAESR